MILPNDGTFDESNRYFKCNNNDKYFSKNAYKEAENVINKIRRTTIKIINCIRQYLSENLVNQRNLDNSIKSIKNTFMNKYHDKEFPEGMKREKFENIIHGFFEENTQIIHAVMLDDNTKLLDKFKREIIDTYKDLHSDLNVFLNKLTFITLTYSETNVKMLKDIGIHDSDAILVDESFYLSTIYQNPVAFITFDNGILKYSDEIKKLFNSNVQIFNPNKFIYNPQ